MAASGKKNKFLVKFELTLKGMIGAGVVCFCVFLWMFLLGVWAGQTILSPLPGPREPLSVDDADRGVPAEPLEPTAAASLSRTLPAEDHPVESPKILVELEPVKDSVLDSVVDDSYLAVQVSAFKSQGNARKELRRWQDKGYEAFLRLPTGNERFTRVFIGKYHSMAGARKQLASLVEREKIKPFIVSISGDAVSRK